MKPLIILLFVISTFTYAHKQHVHQYLTKEGYYLLRNYIGREVPQMVDHLDNATVGPKWSNGTITAGAWLEDDEDIVYGYGYPLDWTVSVSHFWDSDDGDFSFNTFELERDLGTIGPYRNAYDKICSYATPIFVPYGNLMIMLFIITNTSSKLFVEPKEGVARLRFNKFASLKFLWCIMINNSSCLLFSEHKTPNVFNLSAFGRNIGCL